MKVLFVVLLVLSAGFFAFMQWGSALTGASKNAQVMPDLNADKIKLLNTHEVMALPVSAVAAVSAVSAVPVAAAASAVLASPAQSAVMPSVPLASAVAAVSAPVAHVPLAAASAVAMVAPAPSHLPVPVPPSTPAKAAPVVAAKAAGSSCVEWGEFSGTDLKKATVALDAMKLGNNLTQRTVEYDTGYWVYIPPLKNHAAVNKKIGELKALGVTDHFVVQAPRGWRNSISLGVFKTREAANKHLASLKKLGVRTAMVGERKSKLKFTVFVLKHIDAQQAAHLTNLRKGYENSELKKVECQ
jgi:hypothetical protein